MRDIEPKMDSYMNSETKKPEKSKPIYPSFRIDTEHLPEAKKWDLDKEYTVMLKLKMTAISQSRFDNSVEFEIRGIEVGDKMGKMKEKHSSKEMDDE